MHEICTDKKYEAYGCPHIGMQALSDDKMYTLTHEESIIMVLTKEAFRTKVPQMSHHLQQ